MRRSIAAFSVCLATLVVPHASQAAPCANTIETTAFDLRALKSSLMIAALSCSQQADYNAVMQKHGALFDSSGKTISAYFARRYGARATQMTNDFVTQLANRASSYSMQANSETYCQQTAALFTSLKQASSNQLASFAMRPTFTAMHGVAACPDNARVVARN